MQGMQGDSRLCYLEPYLKNRQHTAETQESGDDLKHTCRSVQLSVCAARAHCITVYVTVQGTLKVAICT